MTFRPYLAFILLFLAIRARLNIRAEPSPLLFPRMPRRYFIDALRIP
jgi:hypothetical protein